MQAMLLVDRKPKPLGREPPILWPFDGRTTVGTTIEHFADD